jgi:hypothetical protein
MPKFEKSYFQHHFLQESASKENLFQNIDKNLYFDIVSS